MVNYPLQTVRLKMLILESAETVGNTAKECREWDVPRSTFYRWKKAYAREGEVGLVRKRPIANYYMRQLTPEVVEEILHLRQIYHFGPERITWYLERYYAVRTSYSSVYRTPDF